MDLSRRSLLISGAVAGAGLLGAATPAAAAPNEHERDPLERLLAGNRRFISGRARHLDQSLDRLHEVATGQHPFAVTIGCADSRVPPEVLFDQGLGDIFDNRVAGNIVDDLLLGSIEFAVEEFGSPLIVVLGHERCGAITATVDAIESGGTAPGHIGAIVDALRPIVEPLVGGPGDVVERGVRANVVAQVAALTARSELIAGHVAAGELRIVGARYDLDTGKVTLLR
ncbi:carbonic anhydrase [Paractinoplanes deccanensis]|uniref:carbonic anhydrase n=1 Tax=Paractinoplanes deccanensis TaxID=113561 RepID=A0ABQ3YAI6_9ACTN|nr:carbonic anhydrase [Actinoplanes deccanensis]GID76977.1 carbonic anhydrase [Actinoplanes deccanensis]